MLFTLQLKVQQTDFSQPETATLIEELETTLMYFDEHADHEDRFILAPIAQKEPSITKELESDHVIDHKLSEDLRAYIGKWKTAATDAERVLAGRQIFSAMNGFIAFNLYHMNKEENQFLVLLWKHFSDEEIHGMEQQILEYINQEVLMAESRWMMRNLNNPEIEGWLQGIKFGAPEPVYQIFVKMAEEELPGERFAALNLAQAV